VTSRISIRVEPDITRAVIEGLRLARAAGFSEQDANKISTAVSELARNIVKYAESGGITIATSAGGSDTSLKLIARDRGPGIPNVEKALKDHFSSSGTLGLGLPGVRRMAKTFDIESTVATGTKVTVTFGTKAKPSTLLNALKKSGERRENLRIHGRGTGGVLVEDPEKSSGVDCAYFTRPCRGERANGDGVFLDRRGDLILVALIDGLGHGPNAHNVAAAARRYLRDSWVENVVDTMNGLHQTLKGTIGAAAGIGTLSLVDHIFRYVGVGNTIARTLGPDGTHLMSFEGTLGQNVRSLQQQELMIGPRELLVLYTDGVSERFEMPAFASVKTEAASSIARGIVERFGKDHDDSTCITVCGADA
jgi:anti-sigma regulatory factor (Ser/Thr protein kinase)